MRLFSVKNKESKCPGCNWEQETLFALANSKENAEKFNNEKEPYALCGECVAELLCDGYEIVKKEDGK